MTDEEDLELSLDARSLLNALVDHDKGSIELLMHSFNDDEKLIRVMYRALLITMSATDECLTAVRLITQDPTIDMKSILETYYKLVLQGPPTDDNQDTQ